MQKALYLSAGIAAITLAAFWGATKGEFVQWDDDINIYANPYIQRLDWERLVWMLTDRLVARFSRLPRRFLESIITSFPATETERPWNEN